MDGNRPSRPSLIFAMVGVAAALGCAGEVRFVDGSGGGEEASAVVFRPTVQEDLNNAGCTSSSCHGGGNVPMQLIPLPATEQQWLDNYEAVRARANSLLIPKATDDSHQGAMSSSDPVIHRWQDWISTGMEYKLIGEGPDAGPTNVADAGPAADADPTGALTWTSDIGPIMVTDGCTGCHGQSGAYSLESYEAALGFGRDGTPNVIAGNASSALLVYCENGHKGIGEANTELVRLWIVDNGAAK